LKTVTLARCQDRQIVYGEPMSLYSRWGRAPRLRFV